MEAPGRVKSRELNVVDAASLLRLLCQVPRNGAYRNVARNQCWVKSHIPITELIGTWPGTRGTRFYATSSLSDKNSYFSIWLRLPKSSGRSLASWSKRPLVKSKLPSSLPNQESVSPRTSASAVHTCAVPRERVTSRNQTHSATGSERL